MKKLYFILTTIFLTTSCQMTDVLNVDPPNNLVPENVVTDAESAENLLNGAYSILNDQYYYMFTESTPGLLSGTMSRRGFLADAEIAANAVSANNGSVNSYWKVFYQEIDAANTVLKLIPEVADEEFGDNRKNEILAEAHFLRAMAHFDALRYFGQFYDLNSPLGVVIRTEPADYTTRAKGRATVNEVYDLILNDLDFAIANGPEFSVTYYSSKTAAKALKARVLLFKGEYAAAASLADEVIMDGTRSLSSTYENVFGDNLNSDELIFARYTDELSASKDRKKYTYGSRYAIASPWLMTLMNTDPRAATTYDAGNQAILKVNDSDHFSPTYFIRLGEMYLIKAEGLARSGATLAESKAPLETLRSRAFGTAQTSSATTIDELLDEIYTEYILELAFENGSDWFAGIRFDKIMTVKPEVTSTNQYILPIPLSEIQANNEIDFDDQNPGYNQ